MANGNGDSLNLLQDDGRHRTSGSEVVPAEPESTPRRFSEADELKRNWEHRDFAVCIDAGIQIQRHGCAKKWRHCTESVYPSRQIAQGLSVLDQDEPSAAVTYVRAQDYWSL